MPAVTTGLERPAAPLGSRAVSRRQALLRPEFAYLYPELRAGAWEVAATLADRALAGRLLRGRELVHPGRILCDAHFDFRGGQEQDGAPAPFRPRREDR